MSCSSEIGAAILDARGPRRRPQAVDVGDDGVDLRPGKGELGHLVVRRGDPARQRLAQSQARVSLVQVAEFRGLRVRARTSGADRVTAAAVLLDERLAFPDARFRLGQQRRRYAQSRKAVPGADQRGIEQERRLEIGNRIVLAALRLVDVAAVVVGERVYGIERDGRGVVVDRPSQVPGPAVGEAAAIEGARALRVEAERLREVGNRGRQCLP